MKEVTGLAKFSLIADTERPGFYKFTWCGQTEVETKTMKRRDAMRWLKGKFLELAEDKFNEIKGDK